MKSYIKATAANFFRMLIVFMLVFFLLCDLYAQDNDDPSLSREHATIIELLQNLRDKTDRNHTTILDTSHEIEARSIALADMQELLNNDLLDLLNRVTEYAGMLDLAITTLDMVEERLDKFEEKLNDLEGKTISTIQSTRWVCPYWISTGTPHLDINRQSLVRVAIYNPNDLSVLVNIEWHIYNGELYTESVSIPPWSMEYTDEWTSSTKGPLRGHIIVTASLPVQPAGYNSIVQGPLGIMQRRIKGENTYSLTWYPIVDIR